MIVDIAWWDLDGTPQTVDILRRSLHDSDIHAWSDVEELFLKLWIADPVANRWGAITVWQDHKPSNCVLPPNLASELIGSPPSQRSSFRVVCAASAIGEIMTLLGTASHIRMQGTPASDEESMP